MNDRDICPWHHSEAVEAEIDRVVTVTRDDITTKVITYVVLRCPDENCGRARGVRRKVVTP